jgi:hypothetical protein
LATHARLRGTRQGVLALEARIRGLSAPPTDRIWQRHRTEVDVLSNLSRTDVQLVGLSKEIDEEAGKLDIEAWDHPERVTPLEDSVKKLEQLIATRTQYLLSLS